MDRARVERRLLGAGAMLPARSRVVRGIFALSLMLSVLLGASPVHADVIPQAVELPRLLTLEEALRIFRARGLDLLIAEAAVASAEGDVRIAEVVPNPTLSVSYGRIIGNYDAGCEG